MKVLLNKKWMGNAKGAIKDLTPKQAKILVEDRGIATYVDDYNKICKACGATVDRFGKVVEPVIEEVVEESETSPPKAKGSKK